MGFFGILGFFGCFGGFFGHFWVKNRHFEKKNPQNDPKPIFFHPKSMKFLFPAIHNTPNYRKNQPNRPELHF